MNVQTELIYNKIYTNAVVFLKRAIKELISHEGDALDHEQAIVSCIFIQMAIELGLKAYLIKNNSLNSILLNKYRNKSIQEIYNDFEEGKLRTKTFDEIKKLAIAGGELLDKEKEDYINQFQVYRNQAVHFDLRLVSSDLYDVKYDLIFVLIHVIIPILTEINMDFETPSEFYEKNLDKEDFKTLVKYRPYVEAMEKVAASHSVLVYNCIECDERTYSIDNEMCYCCNLQFTDAGEYTTCIVCKKPRSLIFDPLNIALNGNIMPGLCLNCGNRPQVFKCPSCEKTIPFRNKSELNGTCYTQCEM